METELFECPECGRQVEVQVDPEPPNGIATCEECGGSFEI
jgi:transcription elongation factor Elf1